MVEHYRVVRAERVNHRVLFVREFEFVVTRIVVCRRIGYRFKACKHLIVDFLSGNAGYRGYALPYPVSVLTLIGVIELT